MSADADGPDLGAIRAELDDHGLFEWLDVSITDIGAGHAALTVPFDEKLANVSSGTVHGGVTATVVDTASGIALRTTFDDPAAGSLTTTDLNVKYLRPATDDLRVEAEVVRAGDSVGVTAAEVTVAPGTERQLVATGGTTYRLFRAGGGEDG